MNNIKISDNFNLREFECRHCGVVKLDGHLLEKLQDLRERIGRPLIVTSGYRCAEHNAAVGGVADSQHVQGTAADLRLPRGMVFQDFLRECIAGGFNFVQGYPNQGFVHVDVRG